MGLTNHTHNGLLNHESNSPNVKHMVSSMWMTQSFQNQLKLSNYPNWTHTILPFHPENSN